MEPIESSPIPSTNITEDLPAVEVLQAWIERHFPTDVHRAWGEIGYFAVNNGSGPSPHYSDDRALRAQLRYYSGSSRTVVEDKLRIASEMFAAHGVEHTWYEDSYRYKYLLVECYGSGPGYAATDTDRPNTVPVTSQP